MEEKKYPILPADDVVQNWFEENIDKECSASSAIYKFRLWLESLQRKAITGAVWVKDRLPDSPGDYYCKCKVDAELKSLIVEFDKNGRWGEAPGYDNYQDFEIMEWLDESEPAPAEWDSVRLIGRVKDRFKELEEKQHDWRSFYCAWLEGRVDMLQQIKGYGRLSQEQADLIREANNRDLEGVAGREEAIHRIKDFSLSDVDAPVFTHTREFAAHFSYIKGKLMDILREKGTAAGREEDAVAFAEWIREQNYKPYAGSWFLNGNNYAHQPHSTRNLYELFKQQKEK